MNAFTNGRAVDPLDLLKQRESRARRLEELALEFPEDTLLSFQLNIPGPVKTSPVLALVFAEGLSAIEDRLDRPVLLDKTSGDTGPEAILKTPAPAGAVKRSMILLEESTPLARLYDIDVSRGGRAIHREELGIRPRRCLLCGRSARWCGRAGSHSLDELKAAITALIEADPALKRHRKGPGEA